MEQLLSTQNNWLRLARRCTGMLVICSLLSACVTTTNQRPLGKPDPEKALSQYTELAVRYIQQGKTTEAKKPLQRAMEINPNSADVHNAYAMLFQVEGDYDLADNYYRTALKLESDNTRIRNNYAAFLFQRERYPEACENLELATRDAYYEKRAAVYENLGVCYMELDKDKEALSAFDRAISLDNASSKALLYGGVMHFEQGNIDKSTSYHTSYQQMVRLRSVPNRPENLALGVKLARLKRDQDQEASYLLMLKNLFPDSEEYQELRNAAKQ